LFLWLAGIMMVISGIGSALGWGVEFEAINRATNELEHTKVMVQSLISAEGLTYVFDSMVTNFTGFAPLGTVLVAMIGIGLAEKSGLIGALLNKLTRATPKSLLTVTVVFLGVMSNIASDAGYIVLPPLAALMFISFGRHPIAGLTAAFAGVSGGFSANLLLGTIDPLLGGISTEAARMIDGNYEVLATGNYYFMFVSTFLIALIGWYVTDKIVEPRLGHYEPTADVLEELGDGNLTDLHKKALRATGIFTLGLLAVLTGLFFVIGGKVFLGHGLVPIIVIFFGLPGIVYGKVMGVIKSSDDVMKMIGHALKDMSGYLVLTFFASQFIAFFGYSNIGTVLAVKGAELLTVTGFTGLPLILVFILIVAVLNLFIGSASAKFALIAPIFVPMFMKLGYTPEFTQLAYRIGDSSTNIISVLMSYFAIILVYAQKYKKDANAGSLIAWMLPYSIAFLIGWVILLGIWMGLDLPIGIGAGIHM